MTGMKAMGLYRYGGPEVLQTLELPEPHAAAGEVRIRVRAVAVNPADTLIRSGAAAAAFAAIPAPHIPGLDAAGDLDEIGPGVRSTLRLGMRVMAMVNPTRPAGGAYAEYLVLPADQVVPAPSGATYAQASTLPANGLTARRALDQLDLAPGRTVAVTGAAGAVGGYAVQLAKADGLMVVADAAPADRELVLGLGADIVVPRGDDVAVRILSAVPGGVDGLVDAAAVGGTIVSAIRDGGGFAVVRGTGRTGPALAAAASRGIAVHQTYVHDYDGNLAALDRLRAQAETGALTLRVARTLPAERAADAHRVLARGGTRGRLVLTF